VSTYPRATSALARLRALAASQPGKVTRHAMTVTTMPAALGMEEIAVEPITMIIAKSANAATARLRPNRTHAHLASRGVASCPSSKATAFAMTKTTMRAAIGTKVTVVGPLAIQTKRNIAKNANAGIVLTRPKKMNVLAKKSRASVGIHTSVTEYAMMSTTMLVATGIKATAAAHQKSTKNPIARNASAKIAKQKLKSAQNPVSVVHQPGKATRRVTITTTTADATGMAETAVARKTTINTARCVSVTTPPKKPAPQSVDHLLGLATVFATTTTTTVVAVGIKVTVVGTPRIKTKRSSAKNASVWTPKTRPTRQRRQRAPAHAAIRLGRAMVFATVATIIAAVNTTKAIVVALRAIRISSNFARKTVSASTLLRKHKNLECHSGKRYAATVSSVDFLQPYI